MDKLQAFASELIATTRDHVFIRPEDGLLILRPNRTQHLNGTAVEMLTMLYEQPEVDAPGVVRAIAGKYGVDEQTIAKDLDNLLLSLHRLLNDDPLGGPSVRMTPFGQHEIKFPVLSEIALTYRCTHRCSFCYASAGPRGDRSGEMSTDDAKRVIDRIYDEAHVPTISFTGGEPTLRHDLPELIAHAKGRGMRANLITNGIRCAKPEYVAQLKAAELDSAQVSLEAADAETHDAITKVPTSFERSIRAVRNLRAAEIHTHTNTTICPENADHVLALVDFALDELGSEYLSMNMVIRTGAAVTAGEMPKTIEYSDIGDILTPIIDRAQERGIRLVWYSPVPYCIFNPITAGIGSNSCAAADGLLSIGPTGEVLPCSSFEEGIGNLLHQTFDEVWNSRTARYWRRKEFLPPTCGNCDLKRICCGACPLYWDNVGGFDELDVVDPDRRAGKLAGLKWKLKRRYLGRTCGVGH
ncbi:MAG TPA: radical SAM protein [Armatimonadota bacterium]|nr:radical SAM protein [Armatimonadota bacterium]